MNRKNILIGIPVVGLLFTMILPLISMTVSGLSSDITLFKLFESGGNTILALVFILVSLGVAYCAYVEKKIKYISYALLIPFIWLMIWNSSLGDELREAEIGNYSIGIGTGALLYLIFSIVEIVMAHKAQKSDEKQQ